MAPPGCRSRKSRSILLKRALIGGRDKSLVKTVTRWVRRNWPPDVTSPDLRSGLVPAGASQNFKLGEGHGFFWNFRRFGTFVVTVTDRAEATKVLSRPGLGGCVGTGPPTSRVRISDPASFRRGLHDIAGWGKAGIFLGFSRGRGFCATVTCCPGLHGRGSGIRPGGGPPLPGPPGVGRRRGRAPGSSLGGTSPRRGWSPPPGWRGTWRLS